MKRRILAMLLSAAMVTGSLELPATHVYAVAETVTDAAATHEGADVTEGDATGQGAEIGGNVSGGDVSRGDAANTDVSGADVSGGDVSDGDQAAQEPVSGEAAEIVTATDISAYLTVDASGKITKYDAGSSIADIAIPSTIGGVTVTEIGNDVFKGHDEIASVQLPATLKTIGQKAFEGTGLKAVTIPASVDTIKAYAFHDCTSLKTAVFEDTNEDNPTQITFNRGIYSGIYLFDGCSNLNKITLSKKISKVPTYFAKGCTQLVTVEWPSNLTEIEDYAFQNDSNLTSGDFSNTKLEIVGSQAFHGCSALSKLQFPKGTLTNLKYSAFRGTGITAVEVPASVTDMSAYVFAECTKLETAVFEEPAEENPTAMNFNKGIWLGLFTFTKCTKLSKITLSKRFRVVPEEFASNCTELKTVVWPENLRTIQDEAFKNDQALTSSDFSGTVLESIGYSAFSGCSNLPAAVFPQDTFMTLEEAAFKNAGMEGKLIIPASVNYMGAYVFAGCGKLTEVQFLDAAQENPTPVTFDRGIYIGAYIFEKDSKLSKLTLSNRIQVIPAYFASSCEKLTQITTAKNVSEIGNKAFYVSSKTPLKTTLYTDSEVVKAYDWAGDNRSVTSKTAPEPDVPVVIEITKPTSISVTGNAQLTIGEKEKLTAVVLPADAEDQRLSWTVSGDAVSVDATGTVTALQEGKATVTVTAVADSAVQASITITVVKKQEIEAADVPAQTVNGIWAVLYEEDGKTKNTSNTFTYNGSAVKPVVHVYCDSKRLYEGTDYTISYVKNTAAVSAGENAGKSVAASAWDKKSPAVVITPKGNFKDKAYVLFTIAPKSLADADVTARNLSLKATGKALKVTPVVQYAGKTLKYNKDYEISKIARDGATVDAVSEEGTYTITLSGKANGNFTGTRDITVTVAKTVEKAAYPSIKKATVTYGEAGAKLPGQTYLGTDVPVELNAALLTVQVQDAQKQNVTLKAGVDYQISYQNNRKPGTAKLIITGIGDYAGSSLTKTFKIDKPVLSPAAVTAGQLKISGLEGTFSYVKGGVKPQPTVSWQFAGGRTETLVAGKDYTISYKKNTAVGTDVAELLLKGKGNFAGSVSTHFSIGVQRDGSAVYVQAADVVYKEKANNWKTSVVLYDTDGKKLAAGKDYDKNLSYVVVSVPSGASVPVGLVPNAKTVLPVGTEVKVRAKGIGNYEGAVFNGSFRITPMDIKGVTFQIADQTYTGNPIYPAGAEIKITKTPKGVQATDVTYEIVSYGTNTDKGKGTVLLRGTGNFGGYKTVTFKIGQRSILDWWK